MDPIAEIRERLGKYPDVRYEEGDGWIRYIPSSEQGFVVEFRLDDQDYIVFFEKWHEHFADMEEAFNCFAFGLSDACRLKVVSRGGRPYRWVVESLTDGEWTAESVTALFGIRPSPLAFWRRPRTEVRQNALIKTNQGHWGVRGQV